MVQQTKDLAKFSGGFVDKRAATAFEDDQWAELYGFVLEDSGTVRSQWALQRVGGLTGIASVAVYSGWSGRRFLIAVTTAGAIRWCEAPNPVRMSNHADMTRVWTPLANLDGSTPTNVGDVSVRRPLCTVPLRQVDTAGFRSGLLFNSIDLDNGAATVVVYEGPAGTLRFVQTLDHWPETTADESIPKGEVAALWNGVLVLGDIEWKDNPNLALSSTNKKKHKNGLILSEPGNPFSFNPDNFLHIGDGHARISGLQVVDAGLLILTSSATSGQGGVYLLRGTPADYTLETLREGVGAAQNSDTFWSHTGTVAWVTEYGEIWQSDGANIVQMDWQGLGFDDRDGAGDACREFGPYLLASREGRMVCLRAFDEEAKGAWTELSLGTLTNLDLRFGGQMQDAFYFLANGECWRFTMPETSPASERGSGTLGELELRVGTRTLESGSGHEKTFWGGLGVRATAGDLNPVSAELVSVTLKAGPVRDSTSPSQTRSANLNLAPAGEQLRADAQFRGIGPSREFSAVATFNGDVVVEQLTAFFDKAHRSGSTEGT